ncbi:MAG: WD40 repeat domain-containing protein [Fibrobacterota bacterium]|nr:WD40 repeat domain-containing protein [Fibrobacterota bacterium]
MAELSFMKKKIKVLNPVWERPLGDHIQDLAWSSDGKWLAAAEVSGALTFYSRTGGDPVFAIQAHELGCSSLSWKPDGDFLATGGQDGKVKFWDPVAKKGIRTFDIGSAWVEKVSWNPEGNYLAVVAGKSLHIWSVDEDTLFTYPALVSTVSDIAWDKDGAQLAVSHYGGVTLYAPEKKMPQRAFTWKGSCLNLAWSPDGKYLAGGQQDGCVHFWRLKDGKDSEMHGYPFKVRELAWDFTSRYLATGGSPEITIWDCSGKGPAGTEPICLQGNELSVSALAFRPRHFHLASGGRDGRMVFWDVKSRKSLAMSVLPGGVTKLHWSLDGRFLAASDELGTVSVFDFDAY